MQIAWMTRRTSILFITLVAAGGLAAMGGNPADYPTVEVKNLNPETPVEVMVTDSAGKMLVKKTVGDSSAYGNFPDTEGGLLFVHVTDSKGETVTREVIVPPGQHVVLTVDPKSSSVELTDLTPFGQASGRGMPRSVGD